MSETLALTPQMGTVFAILAFAIYLFVQGDIYEATVLFDSPLIGQSVAQVEALENAPYVVGVFDGKDMRVEPPGPF